MKTGFVHSIFLLLLTCLASTVAWSQKPNILQGITNRVTTLGNMGTGSGGRDSLHIRRLEEDSTTVRVYYLGSTQVYGFDSSIIDYTTRFPIPATHIFLGNDGTATRSIIFDPHLKAGWDPGFHALDVYKWNLDNIRFYNATKPYTELAYTLASKSEQIIEILHTQNIRPYWNFSFNYRLINSPGSFRNQKSNHNNYLLTSWYQSPSKRYNNYFIFLINKLEIGENGGITNTGNLEDPVYDRDRYTIPTNIGGEPAYQANPFDNSLNTGNKYKETNILLRQQYDLGRKDSLVTDTTVIPLFYPRLRFEHTFKYGNYQYSFRDFTFSNSTQTNTPDSAYYKDTYNITINQGGDSVFIQDRWKEISNDFSAYQFPDANNLQQFFKLGLEIQLLKGTLRNSESFFNTIGHAEYRNRTKNLKWDINAFGRLYLAGRNLGDYHAYVSLQRLINPRVGSLQVGFENVNRTAPYIYNQASNFYLDSTAKSFGKENTIHIFGSVLLPRFRVNLSADYYLISNYLYLTQFYKLQQEASLFNVLRINASKTFNLGRYFKWHAELFLQQKTGAVQVHMPALYSRNRIGYEGTLGFRRLNIAIGSEVRYHTPYQADNYSPVLGQFFYQDSVTISNRPQIDAYLHFKIRSFRAYIRLENLNTLDLQGGFHFTNNNLAAPNYPTAGLVFRLGIYWSFVN